jgi:uncharacterized SAM-binding protein YcdF (DUF218 family)
MRAALTLAALAAAGCLDVTHNDRGDPAALARLLADPGPVPAGGRLDVAIVLGCPADAESGAASLCQRCRVKSALRAYRANEVAAVIFSGGAAHNRFVEADVMAELALRQGLPAQAVVREPRALTTWMNLRYSQRLMRERGFRNALIISTADHLPRARRFAEWYGIAARYRACDLD